MKTRSQTLQERIKKGQTALKNLIEHEREFKTSKEKKEFVELVEKLSGYILKQKAEQKQLARDKAVEQKTEKKKPWSQLTIEEKHRARTEQKVPEQKKPLTVAERSRARRAEEAAQKPKRSSTQVHELMIETERRLKKLRREKKKLQYEPNEYEKIFKIYKEGKIKLLSELIAAKIAEGSEIKWDGKTITIAKWGTKGDATSNGEVGDHSKDYVTLPPGAYTITGTVRAYEHDGVTNKWVTKKYEFGESFRLMKPEDGAETSPPKWSVHQLGGTTPIIWLLHGFIGQWFESGRENVWFEPITIRALTPQERRKLGLKGTNLRNPLLGDLSKVQPNPGECMIDFIIYEAMRASTKIDRQELYDAFGGKEHVQENGCSIEQLENYLRHRNDINSYAVDEFNSVFSTFHCTGKVKFYLVFQVNNEHVYPILDPAIKSQVAHTKKLEMGDFQMIVDYKETTEWKLDMEALDKHDLSRPPAGHAVLVDTADLGKIIMTLTEQTGATVTNVKIPDGSKQRATTFEHPITGQLIVAAKQWKDRKRVLETLQKEFNYLGFEWRNQGWGQISQLVFEMKNGLLPASEYPPQYMNILEHSNLKPLIYDTGEADLEKPAIFSATEQRRRSEKGLTDEKMSIDTRRQFTKIMMSFKGKYPRYVATDQIRACTPDEPLVVGDYYVSESFTMEQGTVEYAADWYSHEFIRIAVKRGHIDRKIVTKVIPSSQFYDSKYIREHATWIHEHFPNEAKHLLNHLVGIWGRSVSKKTKQTTTDSWNQVAAIINEDPEHIKPLVLGKIIHLRKYTETRLTRGYMPIWRLIIERSLLDLDRMYNRLVGPDTVVYGYNTDAIKLKNPLPFKTGTEPGDYQMEAKCNVIGSTTTYVKPGWNPTPLVWNTLTPEEARNVNCCLYYGMPGIGKTEEIVRRVKELNAKNMKPIVLAWTRQGVQTILARAKLRVVPITVLTLDAAYPKDVPMHESIGKMARYTDIIVDEVSQLQPKWFAILHNQLRRNPDLCIILAGDMTQTTPMEDNDDPFNLIDYREAAIVNYLCDGNRCKLPYIEGKMSRYDRTTKEKLDILEATGTIDWGDKKLLEHPETTICMTPHTRKQLNNDEFEHNSIGKEVVNGWYVGMPIIAHKTKYGSKKCIIENSTRWTIVMFSDTKVCLQPADGKDIWISQKTLASYFRYGWVETVRRWQGGRVEQPFNIIIEPGTTLNDLYTAIGRTTKWENVRVDTTACLGKYELVPYTFSCREAPFEKVVSKGEIYEWRDKDGIPFYIGRTFVPIKRKLQHRKKPVNKAMKEKMKDETNKMVSIAKWKCTKRQLDALETLYIYKAIANGAKLLNIKKIAMLAKPEIKEAIVHDVRITRFTIEPPTEKRKSYRIQWRDRDGKKCGKEFRSAKDPEGAYKLALEHQRLLDIEYFGVGSR